MSNSEYTNINQMMGKWLERTLWIWLPFHALIRLTRDLIAKHDEDKK
ncbi:MAG: hypothetical protein ACKUBY_01600 [Candidatus Moraniibacteriota bacterium]|jgi:hypothetical protein